MPVGKASIFSYAQDSGDGRAEATEKRRWTEERRMMPNKDVVISRCGTDAVNGRVGLDLRSL